jgi:hypothetical protein
MNKKLVATALLPIAALIAGCASSPSPASTSAVAGTGGIVSVATGIGVGQEPAEIIVDSTGDTVRNIRWTGTSAGNGTLQFYYGDTPASTEPVTFRLSQPLNGGWQLFTWYYGAEVNPERVGFGF